jgi:hypothetical protein
MIAQNKDWLSVKVADHHSISHQKVHGVPKKKNADNPESLYARFFSKVPDEKSLPFLKVIDHDALGLLRGAFFQHIEYVHVFFENVFEAFRLSAQIVEVAMQEVVASDFLTETRTAAALGDGVVEVFVEVGPKRDPIQIVAILSQGVSARAASGQRGAVHSLRCHGQLFIAPDGETSAMFNHVTLWYADKSDTRVA